MCRTDEYQRVFLKTFTHTVNALDEIAQGTEINILKLTCSLRIGNYSKMSTSDGK